MSQPNLWAPWRIEYLGQLGTKTAPAPGSSPNHCFLCDAAEPGLDEATRAERLVLHRDDHGVMLLNRYPYTNGHLLVAPLDHLAELSDLTPAVRAGLMELCELGTRLLKHAVHAQGVNVGLNQGRAAGAGVPGHLHFHVVPRWAGDTNFIDVVGQVRVVPQALESSYTALRDALPAVR
ncbi:MAG: HIT domain-containing protein [Planctomycetota bacterium]